MVAVFRRFYTTTLICGFNSFASVEHSLQVRLHRLEPEYNQQAEAPERSPL